MVKVEGPSRFDREIRERISLVEEIARDCRLSVVSKTDIGVVVQSGIHFSALDNSFRINDRKNYDNALRLARAYEERIRQQATLRKDYED